MHDKKIALTTFHPLMKLPAEILYLVFSFLDEKTLSTLSQVKLHALQELLKRYIKMPYYFRQKIRQLVEELGLLVDPKKMFQGFENPGDLKILYDYLTVYKEREDYNRKFPFNPNALKPLNEKITLLGKILQSSIKNNPVVLLLNTPIELTDLPNFFAPIQSYNQPVAVQGIATRVGSSTVTINPTSLSLTQQMPQMQQFQQLLAKPSIEKISQTFENFKKLEEAGSPVIYLLLIHHGLKNACIINPQSSILTNKIDCSKMQLPVISALFPDQKDPVPMYDYIKTLLAKLEIELPEQEFFYSRNKKGEVLKRSEKTLVDFLKFLSMIDWLKLTRVSTTRLLTGLKLITNYLSRSDADLQRLSVLPYFPRFCDTLTGLDLIQYIFNNHNSMADLKKLVENSEMLQSPSGELIYKKIILDPVYFNNPDYEKQINKWLFQFRSQQHAYRPFGIHPVLMDDFLKKLRKDDMSTKLDSNAIDLLDHFENTCWTIDDFNKFFNTPKKGRKKVDDYTKSQRNLFLKVIPEILSHWSPEAVECFFNKYYDEKVSDSTKAIHKILSDSDHRGLLFKKFKTYEDLQSLYKEINHFDPNKATTFLDILCASGASKICKKILIQNSTINEIKNYISEHAGIIHIMLDFQSSDLLLEILQDKLTLDSIMNDKKNLDFLTEKLATFTGFHSSGNSLQDSLNLTFEVVKKEDSEFLSLLFKNQFCNSYIADYKITPSYVGENAKLFELLHSNFTEKNYPLLKKLHPNKLRSLCQSEILSKLMNVGEVAILQWILFDKNTNTERSIEQIQELFAHDFIGNLEAFKEIKLNFNNMKLTSNGWAETFLTNFPYYTVVLKLLMNDYFSSNSNALRFIAKQGKAFFLNVIKELNQHSSETDKNDMTFVLSHMKRWYSMPWVYELYEVDKGHEIFSKFSLEQIEMLAKHAELFSFLKKNIRFHAKILTSTASSFPSFSNYLKLLKIISELDFKQMKTNSDLCSPSKNFFILLRQYKDMELIECYEGNPVLFKALLNCDKWKLYDAITACEKMNQLNPYQSNDDKLDNVEGHDSKRQKVSHDQKETTSSMDTEENSNEPSKKLSM